MEEFKLPNSSSTEVSVDRDIIVDRALERRAVRKCDLHVVPILVILSMFVLIDRTNIGNTRIEGLEKSLHMKGNDYNIALFVYIIPNCLLQVPNNIILKKTRYPVQFMCFLLFSWGICTIGQGLARTFAGLIATRFLNGCFAGGFLSSSAYIVSQYYTKDEFLFRYVLLYSGTAAAGAFSGLLAYLIELMNGKGGYEGWRWIFILEGILTVLMTIPSLFMVQPPNPRHARFLSSDERDLIVYRVEKEAGPATMNRLDRSSLFRSLKDWKIWAAFMLYFCGDNGASSIAAFQPTILSQLGYSAAEAQLHAIPIYIVAMAFTITACFLSSHLKHRYFFYMTGTVLAIIGWSIELAQVSPVGVRYFGMFSLTAGIYIQMPVAVGWTIDNVSGSLKQGIATGVVVGLGNLGNLISSNVFITGQAPKYPVGFGVGLGITCFTVIPATVLVVGMLIENKKRDKGERNYRLELPPREVENLGDDHPGFRYTL